MIKETKNTFQSNFDNYMKAKDYVKSPFRYCGGKFYALKYIMPFINCVPHDEFREPFLGGGCVFFAKPKSKWNWLNDLESDLIDVYIAMSDAPHRKKLINMLENETASRERHIEVKNMKTDSLIKNAFKTYYLNRTSYSGIIKKPAWGYEDGKSAPPQNWGKLIEKAGEKLSSTKITSVDFEKVIKSNPTGKTVLMYLDPPYFHADQIRAYTQNFKIEDHERLSRILSNTKYYFCLSYDDCNEIRDLYSWAHIYKRTWLYNTANCKNGTRKNGNELIITNYKVNPLQENLFS